MSFYNYTVEDHVAVLRLDRPPVNAVSVQVYLDLEVALNELAANEDVYCVILTGSPNVRAFCGGGDLNEFMVLNGESRMKRFETVDRVLPMISDFPKPIIACVNGPAVGVGVAMVTSCDIRLCADNVFFAIPEIDRGVIAADLPMMKKICVPTGIVKEWILTARRFSAAEAHKYGFIDHVCQPDDLLHQAMRIAKKIASKAPKAIMYHKKAFLESETMSWVECYFKSHEYSAELTEHSNSKEGIKAFLEKREAKYTK